MSCTIMAGLCAVSSRPAVATFHFTQIEQVVAGVNGDTNAQAIQLRIRFPGDNGFQFARLRVWDAAGENPITLIDFATGVPNANIGDRVLVASTDFAKFVEPAITADFTMTELIPDAYLAAGRLTYEGDDGVIFWSLSFGGSAYTGPTTGEEANDVDGEFGPPFDGPLPSTGWQALLFQGTAVDRSTTNQDDYALTPSPAVFTNNARESTTLVSCDEGIDPATGTDLKDFALFESCFGETPPYIDPCCASADLDDEPGIDLTDYNRFFEAFVGP